jgi:(2Fe-2S) ferredoxin
MRAILDAWDCRKSPGVFFVVLPCSSCVSTCAHACLGGPVVFTYRQICLFIWRKSIGSNTNKYWVQYKSIPGRILF